MLAGTRPTVAFAILNFAGLFPPSGSNRTLRGTATFVTISSVTGPRESARELMKTNGVGSLAVINGQGELVGFLQSGTIKRLSKSKQH